MVLPSTAMKMCWRKEPRSISRPGIQSVLHRNFDLGFDINYLPNHRTYFGYILRIISNGDHNIDLIYHQKSHTFRVINGEIFSNVSFQIDSPRLYREWNRINLKFNLENQTIQFEVNGKLIGTCNTPLNFRCFKFLWGANDYLKYKTRDIPPMQLRDIKIYENGSLKYFWPLNEVSGDTEYDGIGKQLAKVKNPTWLRPKYQKWELLNSFTCNGYAERLPLIPRPTGFLLRDRIPWRYFRSTRNMAPWRGFRMAMKI